MVGRAQVRVWVSQERGSVCRHAVMEALLRVLLLVLALVVLLLAVVLLVVVRVVFLWGR